MKIILAFVSMLCLACTTCVSPGGDEPNIRTQPGVEYCGAMCDKFEELNCAPYYEDVLLEDGGTITCAEHCDYLMRNSVPLDPKCIVEFVEKCEDIADMCGM